MDTRGDLYARYVIQSFDQDKKADGAFGENDKIKFSTIDGVEVSSLDIDTAKERPFVQRQKLTF